MKRQRRRKRGGKLSYKELIDLDVTDIDAADIDEKAIAGLEKVDAIDVKAWQDLLDAQTIMRDAGKVKAKANKEKKKKAEEESDDEMSGVESDHDDDDSDSDSDDGKGHDEYVSGQKGRVVKLDRQTGFEF